MNIIKGIGSTINDITGTTSAQKANYQQSLALQKQNQQWQTEMANSAHQREVQDLEKAGLNPVLSAGGGGADTGSPGGGTVGGTSGGDPISMIGNVIAAINNIKNTNANTAKTEADIQNQTDLTKAQVNKLLKEAGYTEKQIEYYNKHGVFPGATITKKRGATALGIIGANTSETIPIGAQQEEIEPTTISGKKIAKFLEDRIKTWRK